MSKTVRVGTAVESDIAQPIQAMMKNHLWMTWTTIAIRSEREAWAAREKQLERDQAERVVEDEHHASLVGVAAASLALDGLHGELAPVARVPEQLKVAWRKNH